MEQSTRRKCSGETQTDVVANKDNTRTLWRGGQSGGTPRCVPPSPPEVKQPALPFPKVCPNNVLRAQKGRKKYFPAVSVQDRKHDHKQETSLTLDRGMSAGGRRGRQTFSPKDQVHP